MPRYFFNVTDGHNMSDEDGHDLPDLKTARCEAVKYAGALICDSASDFWTAGEWEMRVSDDRGLTLFTLVFAGYDAAAVQGFSAPRDMPGAVGQ
jgi:hypothetical protein